MNVIGIVLYVIALAAIIYFFFIKPSRKEKEERRNIYESMEIGDYVLTTSGFYGVLIDVSEEDVIVEFGNNKNCRISMQKKAIAQIEKPDSGNSTPSTTEK